MVSSRSVFRCTLLLTVGRAASSPVCQSSPTIALNLGPCQVLAAGPPATDIFSFGITVSVQGTEICVAPSTTVNSTFLTEASICAENQLDMKDEESQKGVKMTPAQCRSRRGGFVDKSSLTAVDVKEVGDLNPGWPTFNNLTAAASATFQLLDERVADNVGLITEGQRSTQSHLALSSGSTLLRRLKEHGLIGALSWGLNSGSQSIRNSRIGSLVIGGFDSGSLAGPFFDYPVSKTPLEGRYCPLQVWVTGLSIKSRNGTDEEIIDKGNKLNACVEPYDNLFRMPSPVLKRLKEILKVSFVEPSEYSSRLFNLEPGLVYRKDPTPFNTTLKFTINYNQTVIVPFFEMERSLRGLDPDGEVIVDEDYNELQIFGSPAQGDAAVLGKVFLSQLYLYVNYESMSFHLAAQKKEATTPLPEATGCQSPSGLTPTQKGLIAVGSVLGALLLVLLLRAIYKWRRNRTAVPLDDAESIDRRESDEQIAPDNRPPSGGGTIQRPPMVDIASMRNRSDDSIYRRARGSRSSQPTVGSTASPTSPTSANTRNPFSIGG